VRINKLLSNYGYCSRKKANVYIRKGAVLVNGMKAIEGQWVTEEDEILFHGEPLRKKDPLFFIYHKPPGIVSTLEGGVQNGLASVLPMDPYVFPVGRLDKDSEGLLFLTNEGDLAQKLLYSESQVEKEYQVTVASPITDDTLQKLTAGVNIGIGITKPCRVERIQENAFTITLTEGMNRQIRRMAGFFGHEVIKLKRVRILTLFLSDLPPGHLRPLSPKEVKDLRDSLEF